MVVDLGACHSPPPADVHSQGHPRLSMDMPGGCHLLDLMSWQLQICAIKQPVRIVWSKSTDLEPSVYSD